jgi:hypothetical protein
MHIQFVVPMSRESIHISSITVKTNLESFVLIVQYVLLDSRREDSSVVCVP